MLVVLPLEISVVEGSHVVGFRKGILFVYDPVTCRCSRQIARLSFAWKSNPSSDVLAGHIDSRLQQPSYILLGVAGYRWDR